MKIVIEIPEEIYESSKRECEETDDLIIDTLTLAIGNGIPLPKGHGRLIDADALRSIGRYSHTNKDIEYAPTILEATGGE